MGYIKRLYRDLLVSIKNADRNIMMLKAWSSTPEGKVSEDEIDDHLQTLANEKRRDEQKLSWMKQRYPKETTEWDAEYIIFRSKL